VGRLAPALVVGLALVRPASSQVSVYADLSASKLSNGSSTSVLFGPTLGVTALFVNGGRLTVGADLRGSFVGGGQRLDQISIGPRFSFKTKRVEPYAEFLVGFGRYNGGTGSSYTASTDGQIQVNFGVDHRVKKNFDWRVFEFGYEQYYGNGGAFNPKTFSTGVVYHIGGRT
jgi:hypothetical protein